MRRPLSDLADVHYGKSPNEAVDEDGIYPIVGTGGVYGQAARPLFQGPAIVVPRKGSLGNPQYMSEAFWAVDTTYAVMPRKGVHAHWLYFNLAHFDLTKLNEATGVPSISREWLYKIQFEDPGKTAQERIAEILSTVDEAIEQTEALIAKTQQVKAGLMYDLFTRGVTPDGKLRPSFAEAPHFYQKWAFQFVPNAWVHTQLGSVTPENSPICYGIVQPGAHNPEGVPVVAIYNLNTSFSDIHRSSPDIESAYGRSRIRGGDVLLSIKGSIGRVDLTPDDFIGNISRDVARIRPRPGVHPRYLRFALESPYLQFELARISVGTTRAELSIGRLKQVHIYLPPETEQIEIANRIAAVNDFIQKEQCTFAKLCDLKLGLMADLLSGRVCFNFSDTAKAPAYA